DPEKSVLRCEEALEALWRDGRGNLPRVYTGACSRQHLFGGVTGEHLELQVTTVSGTLLQKENGQRVGLLAGRASDRPDTHPLAVGFLAGKNIRNDLLFQVEDGRCVPEKLRGNRQEVIGKRIGLVRFPRNDLEIRREGHHVAQLHSSSQASEQNDPLVYTEIVTRP